MSGYDCAYCPLGGVGEPVMLDGHPAHPDCADACDGMTPDELAEVRRDCCTHDHVERDDDGLSRRFFVCTDCDQEVRYDGPDEDGRVRWEVAS